MKHILFVCALALVQPSVLCAHDRDDDETEQNLQVPHVHVAGADHVPLLFVVAGFVVVLGHAIPDKRVQLLAALLVGFAGVLATAQDRKPHPAESHFAAFKDKVKVRVDGDFLYLESNGMPDHRMMVGITAWQQQVPMPQKYTGRNAWKILQKPNVGDKPVSAQKPENGFTLTSPAFQHKGKMPAEFTGDGDGISPPLTWSGAPEGTKYYALQLWHKPQPNGDEVKSYWVVYNIPANVTSLEKNSKGVGTTGINDKRRASYDPMNSKGPGPKEYHITMYALSAEPKFDTEKVTRGDLLKAVKGITLAETTLSYTYERKAK